MSPKYSKEVQIMRDFMGNKKELVLEHKALRIRVVLCQAATLSHSISDCGSVLNNIYTDDI